MHLSSIKLAIMGCLAFLSLSCEKTQQLNNQEPPKHKSVKGIILYYGQHPIYMNVPLSPIFIILPINYDSLKLDAGCLKLTAMSTTLDYYKVEEANFKPINKTRLYDYWTFAYATLPIKYLNECTNNMDTTTDRQINIEEDDWTTNLCINLSDCQINGSNLKFTNN